MSFGAARVAPEKAVFRPALPMSFLPGIAEMHMATKMTYGEQLKHPNWQRKRLEVLQRDEFTCTVCSDSESTLHVHHKSYIKGRMAWEYEGTQLVTLCETCHEAAHAETDAVKALIAQLPLDGPGCVRDATSLIAGWAHGQQGMDMSDQWNDEPHRFFTGGIAQYLSDRLHLDTILSLLGALEKAPTWVVRSAAADFASALHARVDEPAPPGYGEEAL